MKWGFIFFWIKRNLDYGLMMKIINCWDDFLVVGGGMWNMMKVCKRCIVIVEGFYEWFKMGFKDKFLYYVRWKDGYFMCFVGLWDCV